MKNFIKTQCWVFGWTLLYAFTPLQAQRPFPAGLRPCLQADFRALERLYDSTHGDNWRTHANWFTANMASWFGITLTADSCSVSKISLEINNLTGSLPTLNLPNLKLVYFNGNPLTGPLPNFNLPNLQGLYITNCRLTGAIPNFNLPNLKYISFTGNQLSGTIPNFNLPNLEYLSLAVNQLSGTIPNFNLPNLSSLSLDGNLLTGCIPDSLRIYSPLLGPSNSYISGNAGLTTQDWAAYWNNGTGSCSAQPAFQGGTLTTTLCGDRDIRLPSGRIVNVAGTYTDTVRRYAIAIDTAYQVQIRIDTTCHCQDSIALASFYHTSGGYPNYWDLRTPMNTWVGLSLNERGCVINSWDARPDTPICTQLNQNYLLYADFGIFNALQLPTRWSKNGVLRTDTSFLFLFPFQRADTGRYRSRMTVNGQFSMLPHLQYADSRTIRLKLCCQPSQDSVVQTIREGNCFYWAGINRCVTGIYRDTIREGSYTGCDSIRILNLRTTPCNLRVNINHFGNDFYADAISAVAITSFQWSTGATTPNVALRASGRYSVTVTDTLGCVSTARDTFIFDPALQYLHYRMDSTRWSCAGKGTTTILLNTPLQNGIAYTIRIPFDSSKIQPASVTHYKFLMPTPDTSYLFENIVNGNRLVLIFGIFGVRPMTGNVGDTLLQIDWNAVGNVIPHRSLALLGWVEESLENVGGHSTYALNGQLNPCRSTNAQEEITPSWIKIFPNPSQGIFHLESATQLGTMRIYNGMGQFVQQLQTNEYQYDIDLSESPRGIYILQAGEKVYKIVKQ